MKIRGLILSFTLSMLVVSAVSAQTLPEWKVGKICSEEANRSVCAEFEARAHRLLAGPWSTIQPEIQTACLEQLRQEQIQSYRILKNCLEAEALKAFLSARQN